MRVAVLLNSHPIDGDLGIDYRQWAGLYERFLRLSLNRLDPGLVLEYTCYDVIRKMNYPSTEEMDKLDLLLLTGGTDSLYEDIPWVNRMLEFLRDTIAKMRVSKYKFRLIGICWGHQAIARALGCETVENALGAEMGVTECELSQEGIEFFESRSLKLHQVHRRVVTSVPPGFVCLARSRLSTYQGFKDRDDKILTLQGHPEFNGKTVRSILSVSSYWGAASKEAISLEHEHDGLKVGERICQFVLADKQKALYLAPNMLIDPPLLNASCPWASTRDHLSDLYYCAHTGAVTTRTSMVDGFSETIGHTHAFFQDSTSINSYGFSPIKLNQYLTWIAQLYEESKESVVRKPFIVSIGGSEDELVAAIRLIQNARNKLVKDGSEFIAIELNLSCPNIPHHPPPSYDMQALSSVLENILIPFCKEDNSLVFGLKLTSYSYEKQYVDFVEQLTQKNHCLGSGKSPITYIAATNTVGMALAIDQTGQFMLPTPLGGLAGTSIHPISLGTVYQLRKHLANHSATKHIKLVGIGGVDDTQAYTRMKSAGADFVAVATALGTNGIDVFSKIRGAL